MLHATLAVWQISTFVLNLDSQVTGFPLGKSQNGDDFLVLKVSTELFSCRVSKIASRKPPWTLIEYFPERRHKLPSLYLFFAALLASLAIIVSKCVISRGKIVVGHRTRYITSNLCFVWRSHLCLPEFIKKDTHLRSIARSVKTFSDQSWLLSE